MVKLKGLRNDGSIDTKAITKDYEIYTIVDYLIEYFNQKGSDCILERDGDRITWLSGDGKIVVINISKLKGSDRANFLNSSGIIREYNKLRNNGSSSNNYPEAGSEIDIGGIKGYGFSPGTRGIIEGYYVDIENNQIYANVATPRGTFPIPLEALRYSPK